MNEFSAQKTHSSVLGSQL